MLATVPHRHVVLTMPRHGDGQKAVLYRSRMNPSLGRNFEVMDPLEWMARLTDHIPDPGKHRTHLYAHYANHITDALSIRRSLDPLGLSPPEEKPPLQISEIVRVPVDDEGREIAANPG